VYHVAFLGHEQKLYNALVIQKLVDAGTIDGQKQLLEDYKVNTTRAVLEVHCDGLNDARMARLQQYRGMSAPSWLQGVILMKLAAIRQ
jgi:hypothetical protein